MLHILKDAKDIWNRKELIMTLAQADFKRKFVGSFLGIFWMFIQPIQMNEQRRHYLDYGQNTYFKNHFFNQVLIFIQAISRSPPGLIIVYYCFVQCFF